jgi:hypothetical protein
VNGEIRMQNRRTALDEGAILDAAAQELQEAVARCDLTHLLAENGAAG